MTDGRTASIERVVYIIHAADDHALAGFLKDEFEARIPNTRAFVASRAGQIPTGADWLNDIRENLRTATTFLLLLTPRSIERKWVWYEAGVAWGRNINPLPVAAGGLTLGQIPMPLGAAQAVSLEQPEHASVLFRELGGELETPEVFCEQARHRTLSPPSSGPSPARIREIQQAFGELGEPPRLILRQMLEFGGLTFDDVRDQLKNSEKRFVSDGHSVQQLIDVLKSKGLVEGGTDGVLRIRPELERTITQCLNPTLSSKMNLLADELERWVGSDMGLVDTQAFYQRFHVRVEGLRDLALRLYGEGDPRLLNLNPSSGGGVRSIAEGLRAVAARVP
jgi:hypothetical protein